MVYVHFTLVIVFIVNDIWQRVFDHLIDSHGELCLYRGEEVRGRILFDLNW